MNIPQPLIVKYGQISPLLIEVEKRVNEALATYSQQHGIPFISRRKAVESVAEKIETGRYATFSELDDLVAFTLIVPSLRHEDGAVKFCTETFKIREIKGRASTRKAPDVFRFDTTRLYGHLERPAGSDRGIEPTVFDINFEIQIRTAFEHAWIVATHPLTYKTALVDWKRFRLAATLKASVEQLDLAVLEFETLAAAVKESPWPDIVNRRSVAQRLEHLFQEGVVPSEARPKDLSRFVENFLDLLRASKKKVNLEQALGELEHALRALTADRFPRSVSILQVCMALLYDRGVISGPLQKYACHVTRDLSELFPGVDQLTPAFEYETG